VLETNKNVFAPDNEFSSMILMNKMYDSAVYSYRPIGTIDRPMYFIFYGT
jgi:hypothetical protein